MTRWWGVGVGLWLAASAGCADRVSPEELVELVEAARGCPSSGDADSCALAGAGDCTCAAPVGASEASRIDEAAAAVECADATLPFDDTACASHTNLRCEEERCVTDESP